MTRRRHTPRVPTKFKGALILLVLGLVLYVSYTAQNGLPAQPTYHVDVDVPDAAEIAKNSDVRIGGARVGQVLSITAVPADGHGKPFARLGVALTKGSAYPLAKDTRAKIRLASLLGGKYLELLPGRSEDHIADGGELAVARAIPIVDVDQAFRVFGGETARGLRRVITELGDAMAGRGTSINDTIGEANRTLPPLERVVRVLAERRTRLGPFLSSAAAGVAALVPLTDELQRVTTSGERTLAAVDAAGPGLDATLDTLAPTERSSTRVLHRIAPVLDDAAALADGLRPAARRLPAAAQGLDAILRTATPVLRRVPQVGTPLAATFRQLGRFAQDPSAVAGIKKLKDRDLGEFGASLFLGIGAVLDNAGDAQLHCNAVGIWARNLASAFSDGDSSAAALTFQILLDPEALQQAGTPAANLHFNPYPKQETGACEAGNEHFVPGRVIGHPAALDGGGTDGSGARR